MARTNSRQVLIATTALLVIAGCASNDVDPSCHDSELPCASTGSCPTMDQFIAQVCERSVDSGKHVFVAIANDCAGVTIRNFANLYAEEGDFDASGTLVGSAGGSDIPDKDGCFAHSQGRECSDVPGAMAMERDCPAAAHAQP